MQRRTTPDEANTQSHHHRVVVLFIGSYFIRPMPFYIPIFILAPFAVRGAEMADARHRTIVHPISTLDPSNHIKPHLNWHVIASSTASHHKQMYVRMAKWICRHV